eukprot:10047664-Alexandrium_andersonii.AAC.1
MQAYFPTRGGMTDEEIKAEGVPTRAQRVGWRTFFQVSNGMTHVLADKLALLPFVPGQGGVVEHLPPLRTDEAVA